MILGITGGTGCGKTTLLSCIQDRGGLVLDCDAVYRELLERDKALLAAIDARFPGVTAGGVLDRKKLGAIVFADPNALSELNAITHSAIRAEILHRLSPAPALAAIDAIALFESGLSALCDCTVAVVAPPEDRVTRLIARDGISEAYARSRIAAQPTEDWFRQHCDYVLDNEGSLEAFQQQCRSFLDQLNLEIQGRGLPSAEKHTEE